MSQEAFENVVSAHHGEIFRYLQRVIGRAGDVDDLSQETFLRAFRAYGSLPGDANVRAWLFAIATNLPRITSAGRRAAAGLREVRAFMRETVERAGGRAGLSRDRGAGGGIVRRLPLKQRLAFTQRKIHGWTTSDRSESELLGRDRPGARVSGGPEDPSGPRWPRPSPRGARR